MSLGRKGLQEYQALDPNCYTLGEGAKSQGFKSSTYKLDASFNYYTYNENYIRF